MYFMASHKIGVALLALDLHFIQSAFMHFLGIKPMTLVYALLLKLQDCLDAYEAVQLNVSLFMQVFV